MINPFLMPLTIALVTVVFIVVIVLVWLVRAHLQLRHDYRALANVVHDNNNDIADLYAAVVTVNGNIAATDEQISVLCAKFSDYQHNEPYSQALQKIRSGANANELMQNAGLSQDEAAFHPYSLAIQKVRSGASVNELMQNSGLSQDEAALLIRLHGPKAQL